MRKNRAPRIFKNDPFGFKEKIFRYRVNKSLEDFAHINSTIVKLAITGIDKIGIPKNNKEKEELRKYLDAFDNSIAELQEHTKYARRYLED